MVYSPILVSLVVLFSKTATLITGKFLVVFVAFIGFVGKKSSSLIYINSSQIFVENLLLQKHVKC